MIKLANKDDVIELASMLHSMYNEMQPDYASTDGLVYVSSIVESLNDAKQFVYISHGKGFFIIRDETETTTPSLKVYNGIRVYIKPRYRKGRLLKQFYDTMFSDFPDGDIIGLTWLHSEHIPVLEKRHTRIANLYKLNRS